MTEQPLSISLSREPESLSTRLWRYLQTHPPTERDMIARHLGVARTTIYDNLIKLQHAKLVEKYQAPPHRRGRPKILWRVRQ